ncbi:AraC-like DNA-binding protein [Oikeobacillus pervagus]|uniref:AraC-like DNA-binding protein n=1 Tax=Oikeobacillus pervagus TaxID=1325931 RepID=A0AAJ1WK19_9BACI|nr:AraC family transcriptional regulator [Oikeobacillus pervagus]MDQ0216103.1 AraC-like DNA-binding protein [Oikeobacillus pervagus]
MTYHPALQKTIDYIEEHLDRHLSLEELASIAGFSKYHFHRLFQKEIGFTVAEFIRNRRMCYACSLLLHTDEKILDIAQSVQFESQESFTRSFKKVYKLPPGQFRKLFSKINNKKEEVPMGKQTLKGWFLSGSHPFHYEMGIDQQIFHEGRSSGFLTSVTVQSAEEFATMMQQFKADKYIGKRIKLTGFIKTKEVEGFCGMWMRVDNTLHDILQFDNMSDRPITGDTNWNHYSIVLDIPETSAVISFGVLLSGKGKVWVDQLSFQEVDESVPTTHQEFSGELLEEPVNLSFEDVEDIL